jgi:hypothetical protein
MIIAHIVKVFATRIAVFVKSLMEAMPGGMHIILHGKRKKEMTSAEHRSIDSLKGLFALVEIYMLRRLKQKKLSTSLTFTLLKKWPAEKDVSF